MYSIQIAKYGYRWKNASWDESSEFEKLEDAIDFCKDFDGDGKLHCRVIDENEQVIFTRALTYENSIHVDHTDDTCKWMDSILSDHSLPKELILKGILAWLSRNTRAKL